MGVLNLFRDDAVHLSSVIRIPVENMTPFLTISLKAKFEQQYYKFLFLLAIINDFSFFIKFQF